MLPNCTKLQRGTGPPRVLIFQAPEISADDAGVPVSAKTESESPKTAAPEISVDEIVLFIMLRPHWTKSRLLIVILAVFKECTTDRTVYALKCRLFYTAAFTALPEIAVA